MKQALLPPVRKLLPVRATSVRDVAASPGTESFFDMTVCVVCCICSMWRLGFDGFVAGFVVESWDAGLVVGLGGVFGELDVDVDVEWA